MNKTIILILLLLCIKSVSGNSIKADNYFQDNVIAVYLEQGSIYSSQLKQNIPKITNMFYRSLIFFEEQYTKESNINMQLFFINSESTAHTDRSNKIFINYPNDDSFIEIVLSHEIAHIMINNFIGINTNIREFFGQGAAEYFSTFQFYPNKVFIPKDYKNYYKKAIFSQQEYPFIPHIAAAYIEYLFTYIDYYQFKNFYLEINKENYKKTIKKYTGKNFKAFCLGFEKYVDKKYVYKKK